MNTLLRYQRKAQRVAHMGATASAHSDFISPHPPSLRFNSRSGHGECGSDLEPSHVLVSVDLVTFFLLRNRAHGFGYVLRSALTPLELSDESISV